jgi:hypothetical protein
LTNSTAPVTRNESSTDPSPPIEEEEEDDWPQSEIITFHIVCHSHDDVGWQMTPEDYYNKKVREILSNVVKALEKDSKRRFS